MKRHIAPLTICLGLMSGTAALAQDAQGWCKSKFGPNDEIGAANHMNPAATLEAAKLIKTGKVYPLGVETNSKSPAYPPRTFNLTVIQPGQGGGTTLGPTKTSYNDDIITGWVGTGSQLDGLGHIGVDNMYYNCNHSKDFAAADGLKKLGVEKLPPMVARGIVLDMTAVFGKNPVPGGTPINKKEIDEALSKQGIAIKKGDVVLAAYRLATDGHLRSQGVHGDGTGARQGRRGVSGLQGSDGGRRRSVGARGAPL